MKKWISILIAVLIFCTLLLVLTKVSSTKTGYVKLNEVFDQFEYTKQLKKEFELVKNARQRKVDSMNFELKVLAQKLETSKDKELVSMFEVKRRDFIYIKEGIIQDNEALTEKYDNQIHKQMQSYLVDFGKENGYDYILGSENLGTVLFAKEKYDVTVEAIAYLNDRFKAKK